MKSVFDEVKEVIKENFYDASCGLFFTHNWAGDQMDNLWNSSDGRVQIDICYGYLYYEVFGLTKEEQKELEEFYETLESSI